MKIGHVIHNLGSGGAETMVLGLARAQAQAGHGIEIIRLDEASGSAYESMATESLETAGIATCTLGRKPGSCLMGLTAAAKLWRLAQKRPFDVMHSHLGLPAIFTGLARRMNPSPFEHVLTVHGTKDTRGSFAQFLCGYPTLVYCSRASEKSVRLKHSRSVVIPNGIALEKYAYSPARRTALRGSLGLPESALLLISVGNLRHEKNYNCAIAGFATDQSLLADRDIHYLICGDGPEGPRLKAQVKELGLEGRVHFLGVRTDVADLLSAADLYLSTSLYEGMPLAVLEALAASLPCLLAPLEEHREIAEGVASVEFLAAHSADAVAIGLRSMTAARPDRAELSVMRAGSLDRFDIARCASAHLALYQELRMERPGVSKYAPAAN